MRWKTIDPLSGMEGGTVYQEFLITVEYACYNDVIALDNAADNDANRVVVDGATATVISGSYDSSNSGCDWTAALEVYDDTLEEWSSTNPEANIMTIDAATGDITSMVDTAGGTVGSQASFVEYSIRARVVYESTWSGNKSYDEFDVTFRNACYGNTITTTSTNDLLQTYNVDSSLASDKVDPVFTAAQTHANCPRTCTFEVWDEDFLVWRSYDTTAGPYTTADLYTRQPWATIATDGTCTVTISQSSSDTFWTTAMQSNRKDF